jgi:hypothetical protein
MFVEFTPEERRRCRPVQSVEEIRLVEFESAKDSIVLHFGKKVVWS